MQGRVELVGLAANTDIHVLAQQVRETGVRDIAIYDSSKEAELRGLCPRVRGFAPARRVW